MSSLSPRYATRVPNEARRIARRTEGDGFESRAGVAETGSVVLADDALTPRLLGMLADLCLILLPAADIMPSLDEVGNLLHELEREGRRYVSLVTGPSRTADIERVLTIGVQGPKALHIIVLSEDRN